MKIILLRDVPGVGQKGTIKQVSDGYAVNYLIPQKLAEAADAKKIAALEDAQKEADARRAREQEEAAEVAKHLEGAFITLRVQANAEGYLYSQVTEKQILARIRAERGVEVPDGAVVIPAPIKSLGRAVVSIRLGERRVPITVSIERAN